jgi:hypothetical protein
MDIMVDPLRTATSGLGGFPNNSTEDDIDA